MLESGVRGVVVATLNCGENPAEERPGGNGNPAKEEKAKSAVDSRCRDCL